MVAGFHATVFVYGQTGSGKTHTMEGYKYQQKYGDLIPQIKAQHNPAVPHYEQDGLIPRCIRELFDLIELKKEKDKSNRITVTVQYI